MHDEPVYRDGVMVGQTTSGGLGFRTGLALCFANVRCEPGDSRAVAASGDWHIAIAGERHPLRALARAAYDPEGERLRA